jgi:probable O-glycosylation ligase (exosortase A-associated)
LGILAVKGAIWGVLTEGAYRVYGTQRSFLADNNDFALALNMTLPISFFLARQETNRKLRFVLWTIFISSIISVILTYSRGGLAALVVVLAALSVKSHRKLLAVLLAGTFALGLLAFTPEHWQERMSGTFVHGQLDDSAEDRLAVWEYAWNLAKAFPVTGGGFESFTPGLFAKYEERPLPSSQYTALGPHSIYFQVLAEHGFAGLFLYFVLLVNTVWTTIRMRRVASQYPGMEWMKAYCDIVQVGIVAFLIGGAFLGRAYSDLYYEFIACAFLLRILYRRTVIAEAWQEPVMATTPELLPA